LSVPYFTDDRDSTSELQSLAAIGAPDDSDSREARVDRFHAEQTLHLAVEFQAELPDLD